MCAWDRLHNFADFCCFCDIAALKNGFWGVGIRYISGYMERIPAPALSLFSLEPHPWECGSDLSIQLEKQTHREAFPGEEEMALPGFISCPQTLFLCMSEVRCFWGICLSLITPCSHFCSLNFYAWLCFVLLSYKFVMLAWVFNYLLCFWNCNKLTSLNHFGQ